MATQTEICNLAISHLGIGKQISNVTTEDSEEAAACRTYFDITRDEILRDFTWPFASKFVALTKIKDDPNEHWGYEYQYPSDCLQFRKIQSADRNDARQTRISYKLWRGENNTTIYTDEPDAIGEYTVKITDTTFYPPDFVMAMSYKLAFYLAPRLTAGDPFQLQDRVLQMYLLMMSKAQANAFNEEQPDEDVDSEMTRARNS